MKIRPVHEKLMNILNQKYRIRFALGAIAIIGAASAGCSQSPQPTTSTERASFLGDPSKMPADQKQKLQEFQQSAQQQQQQASQAARQKAAQQPAKP